ncbi:MAG: hypothetical protein M5U12_24545 [Verrucomicrobia bacterium]|nr:hypothetical protein [Verrucomicrobiota bacterium]
MTYLDTGCLVKLYYPEPQSSQVIAAIQGKPVCFTPLHKLEFVNALHLNVFAERHNRPSGLSARALVEVDLRAGVLVETNALGQRLSEGGGVGRTPHGSRRVSVSRHPA